MNKQRLLKLADFIGKLPKRKLEMPEIARVDMETGRMNPNECGSVACAMGWSPFVFPRLLGHEETYDGSLERAVVSKKTGNINWLAMVEIFNISHDDADELFGGGDDGYETPKEVAKGIRRYVNTGKLPLHK